MKKCIHCGRDLSDQAVVCIKCGYIQKEYREKLTVEDVFGVPAEKPFSADVSMVLSEPMVPAVPTAPSGQLKTNRGMLKFVLLSLITFGIYGIVVMSVVSTDINVIASRYDGKKTMHYCWVYFLLSWLTLGIVPLVWYHKLSGRIGSELCRRGIDYRFGAGSFWGWNILGSLIVVGPLVYLHKLLKAMNLLAENYNICG